MAEFSLNHHPDFDVSKLTRPESGPRFKYIVLSSAVLQSSLPGGTSTPFQTSETVTAPRPNSEIPLITHGNAFVMSSYPCGPLYPTFAPGASPYGTMPGYAQPLPTSSPLAPPPAVPPQYRHLNSEDVILVVRQQPREALVLTAGKDKNRKPVDPPPIIQLLVHQDADPQKHFLQSPYLFMTCTLYDQNGDNPVVGESGSSVKKESVLAGCLVSSLHRLKDNENTEGAFFVFGDLSVRVTGRYRIRFTLFDLHKEEKEVASLGYVTSEAFSVVAQKDFRGLEESTPLSRCFADQGVRMRLRKEPRGYNTNKRRYSCAQSYSHESSDNLDRGTAENDGYDAKTKRVRSAPFFEPLAVRTPILPPFTTSTSLLPSPTTNLIPSIDFSFEPPPSTYPDQSW